MIENDENIFFYKNILSMFEVLVDQHKEIGVLDDKYNSDTLNLLAGTNMAFTTNASTKTITINNNSLFRTSGFSNSYITCYDTTTQNQNANVRVANPITINTTQAGANIQNQNTKHKPNPIKNAFQVDGIPPKADVNADNIIITNSTNKFFFIMFVFNCYFLSSKISISFHLCKSFLNSF